MNENLLFTDALFQHAELEAVSILFDDSEGEFPANQLQKYIESYEFDVVLFAYHLVKYAVYRGTNIAIQENFFTFLKEKIGKITPEILFWRAYDAVIRGQIALFKELWLSYMSIELKNYNKAFIIEALVIPEDPVFLNVEKVVHDHQQRLIQTYVLQGDTKSKFSDTVSDTKLSEYIGDFSLLLSVFRLLQTSFERDIIFNDLDNLLTLITNDNINLLGPYWEMRFLSIICYWKTTLGLVFDVVDNLANLKNLNGLATNFLIESQVFHIEAIIAFKNNQLEDSIQLLQSAYYLSHEYNFFYQSIEVLFSKFVIDVKNLQRTKNEIMSLTNEKEHPLLRAKLYAMMGAYYIQEKNWPAAETQLLQASKLVQDTYEKKTYYQVIADFSYVLVITNQLQEALESSVVLLDDNVGLLYRIRGFYLYGLTLLLLDQKKDAIEILEEGIRIALSFKEHISLPWFYEILEFIYISNKDIETSLRYCNLTFEAYFDSSKLEDGYRAKLRASYILSLHKDYGRSLSQSTGLLSESISPKLQNETFSLLQLSFLASNEQHKKNKIQEIYENITLGVQSESLTDLIEYKNKILSISTSTIEFHSIFKIDSKDSFKDLSCKFEFFLLSILYPESVNISISEYQDFITALLNFLSTMRIQLSIFSDLKFLITNKITNSINSNQTEFNFSMEDKALIFAAVFLLGILRNLVENLPFNFLFKEQHNYNL